MHALADIESDSNSVTKCWRTGLTLVCRPGFGPFHSADVAGKEPVHQTPVTGQELHQHQVQVSVIQWRGRGGRMWVLLFLGGALGELKNRNSQKIVCHS